MRTSYIIIFCIFYSMVCQAQVTTGKCELLGHVIDKSTNEHLPYVNIYIKGGVKGTTSDATGHFVLTGLPEGKVTLVAQFVGYATIEREVILSPSRTTEVVFEMIEETFELNPVVITANRNETSRKEAPAIINVLPPLLFEVTNSNTLSEGLNFLAGLRVENDCQNCGYQQVRINGLDGKYSQILIDSRPIVSALNGVYGIEQIPAGMLERVEVMRGGGSALYGSNAIGGTINIITKEPLHNSGVLSSNITMIGGNNADISTNMNLSLVSNDHKTGVYIFSNIKHRETYDSNDDDYSELPELKGVTSGFRGFYKSSDYSKLTLEYHNITEFRRGGNDLDLPAHESDITEQLDHHINGGGLKYDIYTRNYKQKISLYASAQHTDRKSFYGGNETDENDNKVPYGGYGTTKDMTYDAGTQYSYSFDKLFFMPSNLVAGIEYNSSQLEDKTPAYGRYVDQHVQTGSFFLQNEWKNNRFSFLLGGRLDKHNMVDNLIFSPCVNFRYSPVEDIAFRTSYSTGFLAPQAFSEDLHIDAANGVLSIIELDPDLEQETSVSYNASVDWYHIFGKVQTNVLLEGFYTKLDDVFILDETGRDEQGNILKTKRNGAGATVKGINLEGKAILGNNYQLQTGFTFQESRYKEAESWSDTAEPTRKMPRTPAIYGYFTVTCNAVRNLSVSLSGTYTGKMYVPHLAGYIEDDVLEKTSGFFDTNFKIAYTFPLKGETKLQLSAGIQNVFDAYQSDFDKGPNRDSAYIYGPTYPRSFFAGIKLSL